MHFTVLENYQQFTQKKNDEKTIECGLNLLQSGKAKNDIIQIISQTSNNLSNEKQRFTNQLKEIFG